MVTVQTAAESLAGRRVLVTGGTGFIGGRLVERLVLEARASVRVLVRSYARAPYVARFPVEMVRADLTDLAQVEQALDGCDLVLHCACQTDGSEKSQRAVTFGGTVNVLEAARRGAGQRVVHISTINVYGPPRDGDLDETHPRRPSGDVYSDSKVDAEKAALDAARQGLPVVVLQPTIVYGPAGPAWTTRILNELKTGRPILVDGGSGLCNAVYVDDVVSAILLAAHHDDAPGEAFLISGERPITWREFYAGYERMLGVSRTVSMSAAEAEEHFRKHTRKTRLHRESLRILREEAAVRQRIRGTLEVGAMVRAVRLLLPRAVRSSLKSRLVARGGAAAAATAAPTDGELPVHPLPPGLIRLLSAKPHVRIDKAQRVLGYRPEFDFEAGMELTALWARWANLLDDPSVAELVH